MNRCVVLSGGISVLADALVLAWDLEAKDVSMLIDETGALQVGPVGRLTPADIVAIKANREELKRIVVYCGNPWKVM